MTKTQSKPSMPLGSFSFPPSILLGAILLLAFALRIAQLIFQPLWWDEGYSVFFATRDLGTLLDRTALDIHPPLYYLLLKLWTFFVGTNDYATRFMSLLIGVLAIPFIYGLARRLARNTTARIAAFLFAIAPIEIYYSQEVRMYGLVTLLCLASTYFFVRLIENPAGQPKNAVLAAAYVLVSAAALYTEYYAAFVLAFHIVFASTRSRFTFYAFRSWLLAWASIALLYLPWISYAGEKLYKYVIFKVGHEAYPAQDPISFLAQHLAVFSVGHVSNFSWLSWASILFIGLAGFGLIRRFSFAFHRSPAFLLTLYLFVPLALGYAVNLRFPFHPIRYERLLLLASPAFFLLVASGILAMNHRAVRTVICIFLAIFSIASLYDYYTVARYPNDDYRPLIAQMQTGAQHGDNFLGIYPWQIGYLESYYAGAPLNITETPNDAWTQNPATLRSDLNALLAKHPRVWLPALQTLGRIVEYSLDAELRPTNYSVLDTWFGTTRLELFQHAVDPPRASRALRIDGSEWSNWGVSAHPLVSGQDIAHVWFDWGNLAQKKLSLRIVDTKGNIWAQDDRDTERGIQRIGLVIPAGTPPGAYDLRLALYRANETASEAVSIATINVTANDQPNLAAIPRRTRVTFGDGMQLIGSDTSDKPLKPGFDSGITLFWQTSQKQNTDYWASIQLQDMFGKIHLDASDTIARGTYGSSQWRDNELVRDPRTFTVPANLPEGTYTLAVALIDPATQARIGNAMRLLQVQVKRRSHYFGTPSPSQRLDARVDEIGKLIGYDLVRSGQNLRVVLYWQALGRGPIAYQVFLHVVDASGKIFAQKDQTPGGGEFPTTTWVKGEYLVDEYAITLPSNLGDFQVRIGMYDPGSGARLLALDSAGNPIGDFVTIR